MKVVMSSGHGKYIRGASGYLDEVNEARRVVDQVAAVLETMGVSVTTFHDDVSDDQSENLNRIVDFHNSKSRDLDISVHFNAYQTTSSPMGTEVLYVSSGGLEYAELTVDKIAAVGFINRGPKKRTDLFFLNNTEMPAILIETCFVDSRADADLYKSHFNEVCNAIASAISGEESGSRPPVPNPPVIGADEKAIMKIAMDSRIATYHWRDRGIAPDGYIKGFALAWATVVRKFLDGDLAALEMAKADAHNEEIDALSWYREEFGILGASNDHAGLSTLRHLFALLYGLGMRESSGQHCCGRDQSASNVTSDTAEAGLYQTSYNAHTVSPLFDKVMSDYERGRFPNYLDVFAEEVSCSQADWANYGSGKGRDFQRLCKEVPPFAIESAALVLRLRRQHYGPINRKEAELKIETDWMLIDVQRYVTHETGNTT